MKKRRTLLFTLLALLLVVGTLSGFVMREYRNEQASRDLIDAIQAEDTDRAVAALKAGADPNTRDRSYDKPLSFGEYLRHLQNKILHLKTKGEPDEHPTALLLVLDETREENPTLVKDLLDAGA